MFNRKIIRITIASLILVGITGYALFESRKLRGPVITIEKPRNGAVSTTPVTDIKGVVKNVARITMNDRAISVDPEGVFQEKFVLSNGSNMVKLSAEDRFGRRTESFVQILYTEPNKPLVRNDTVVTGYQ